MTALAELCRRQPDEADSVFGFLVSSVSRFDGDSEFENALAISFLLHDELVDLGAPNELVVISSKDRNHERNSHGT